MFGRPRLKKQFCRAHPNRKCEFFCRDHHALICSLCLKEKHRDCDVADDHEFKNYYAKKIKDVRMLLDADRGDLVAQTSAIIAALDAGIGRLEKFKTFQMKEFEVLFDQKDVDVVVDRLEDMKDEVGGHRQDLQKTSDTLGEIERQLVNAYDLRTCQQCYADVDLEKARFQRKERKIVQVPSRLNEEVDATMNALQRRLKTIRNGVGSQLSSTKLVRGNSRSFREPAGASTLFPYMDVEHHVTLKRPKDHARNDGRLAKWPDMTDVRFDQRFHSRRNQMPRLPTLH